MCFQMQMHFTRIMGDQDQACHRLRLMGVPEDLAKQAGNTRRGHWFATHTVAVNMAMTKERLINSGFYDLATAYQSVHVNY